MTNDAPHDSKSDAVTQVRVKPVIEIGWLIPHQLDDVTDDAVAKGRALLKEELQQKFGQFDWRIPVVRKPRPVHESQLEPILLLEEGTQLREMKHWDLVFVLTNGDLKCYYKPYAQAVSSRALNAAVISTVRLAPERVDDVSEAEYVAQMAQRIHHLGMHLLGDLLGLAHQTDPQSYMYRPETSADLDQMQTFTDAQRNKLGSELDDLADERLEEKNELLNVGRWRFYVRAAWIGRDDIYRAVLQARPWQFPYRLSGLTTTAFSTMTVLIITAEVWDLGMSQAPALVAGLSALALLIASAFILGRQKLVQYRVRKKLTEQVVFTNVSVTLVVLLGMMTTYVMLFTATLLLTALFYSRHLVEGWAESLDRHILFHHYVLLAGFVASLGILIGSLGASFENQYYFRHVTYVDEET